MITEENFVDFKCPYCGELVSFPHEAAGFVQECPNCIESLIVPEAGSALGRTLPIPLTTSRLVLRRFESGDWKALMGRLSDEQFWLYSEGFPLQGNDESVREDAVLQWLELDRQVRITTPDQFFRLAILPKEGGDLMGYLRMHFIDSQRLQAEFDIDLHRDYQRKGFGTEATQALLNFCFKGIKLHRVTASCDSQNAGAGRMLEKVGMRREGEFVKNYSFDGEWRNRAWYGMLSEEWRL